MLECAADDEDVDSEPEVGDVRVGSLSNSLTPCLGSAFLLVVSWCIVGERSERTEWVSLCGSPLGVELFAFDAGVHCLLAVGRKALWVTVCMVPRRLAPIKPFMRYRAPLNRMGIFEVHDCDPGWLLPHNGSLSGLLERKYVVSRGAAQSEDWLASSVCCSRCDVCCI